MELCSNRGCLYVRDIQNRPAFPLLRSLNRTSDVAQHNTSSKYLSKNPKLCNGSATKMTFCEQPFLAMAI